MKIVSGFLHSPLSETIPADTIKITIVRINVARFDGISDTPIFPKIAVSAAKNAEPSAKISQLARLIPMIILTFTLLVRL